jgi:hypothetical protein
MALINKKVVAERETASYKLDRATTELVRCYAEFIGSPQEHVVNEALLFIFRKDKDFSEWLKSTGKTDVLAGLEQASRRNRGLRPAAPAFPERSAAKAGR